MNFFITQGTPDYLDRLKNLHDQEKMALFFNELTGLLMHETGAMSVFKEPRKYEVIDSVGGFENAGFAVLNNIPVTDEGRPLFEYRFKNRAGLIEKEPGFISIRVLRPISNDTYIILTLWEGEKYFKQWQASEAYNNAHKKRGTSEGVEQQKTIFPRPSYLQTYYLYDGNDE